MSILSKFSIPKISLRFPSMLGRPTVKVTKKSAIILSVIFGILLLLVGTGLYTYAKATEIKLQSLTVRTHLNQAYDGLKNQNLTQAKTELAQAVSEYQSIKASYAGLSLHRFTPLRWHYQDGEQLLLATDAAFHAATTLIEAVEPYADVIGFEGEGSFLGGTAEDRIIKIVETLEYVTPSLDVVIEDIDTINTHIATINPSRYPFEISGQKVPELINQAQIMLSQASDTITKTKPVLEALPGVAGASEPKTYLVLFQNDAELRPTGGFLTAYSILTVEKGKVTPQKSDDIYDLDSKFTTRLDPPPILKEYLNVSRYNLRDMNVSPDFKVAMDLFMEQYQGIRGEPEVDGVITVDTQVLNNLVTVLGPIEVPGYGTFTSDIDPRCNCPQIIYALEDIATRPTPYFRSDRKAVLGPLMQTILFKAYGAPKQVWPDLFSTIWESVTQKHVLFYFFDDTTQAAVETNNFAGRIFTDVQGDYLHVNDSNLGGAKSNMFVSQEITQDYEIGEEGSLTKTLTLTYKNPAKGSNCNLEAGQLCLNGRMPSWLRVYVPEGSILLNSSGLDKEFETIEELGKTVFSGVYILDPESQVTITFRYTLPFSAEETIPLTIQKQPSLKNPYYVIKSPVAREEFELLTDTTLDLPL
jgi:hypothetical protein